MTRTERKAELIEILNSGDIGIAAVNIEIELEQIIAEEAEEENQMEYLDKFDGLPTLKPLTPFS
tara:strand:+ start:1156 stop:1347 length:192 start_codon:yes stop_codon:yes gene_type:complete